MKLIFIKKKWVVLGLISFVLIFGSWYFIEKEAIPTMSQKKETFTINMVTGEFKTTTEDGKEIEAYRWDPGTIVVPQGKDINLSIYGVNGKEHPFIIEGTDIKGKVTKGKETVLTVRFEEEGIYRLICLTHKDISHNGPMIAYIIVD
jgi:heme/copper-type cytochrome/quinol oxidase subunit 2